MKYICKKSSFTNHQIKKCQMFAISLSSCSRYNANVKFDQSVSAIHDSPPYFWDQWEWPPTETALVTHVRDHWWTLDFANAFVSPGVNSRAELVPLTRAYARNGAPRLWLGDNQLNLFKSDLLNLYLLFVVIFHVGGYHWHTNSCFQSDI
jgi:hypothetical protein